MITDLGVKIRATGKGGRIRNAQEVQTNLNSRLSMLTKSRR